ncbi:AAA family ATPase [Rhodococcus pseudokoreensis]|uniref:AAA family ATPase n=1 Tax=Rhodococcus pseudokoreensis TaxID=2811421 RepID=A0A974W7T0_9NOCA|nr:AAA family ATPase [Rhodococcus pseudokoreensis]QSE92848.1 AAA family ATPase [Rhodococcus pseudokoreensis]
MNEFVFDCAIERLSAGAGSTYLILGEAGTGKTHLLRSTIDAARRRGWTCLYAAAHEYDRDIPYATVRTLVGVHGHTAVPSDPNGVTALLQSMTDSSPVVVVVDDAHLADEDSLVAVTLAARHLAGRPLLVIFASRTRPWTTGERLVATIGHLVSEQAQTVLELRPVEGRALGELIESVLGAAPDERLTGYLTERTRGNALLVRETVNALRTAGAVRIEQGIGYLVDDSPPRFPRPAALLHRLLPGDHAVRALGRLVSVFGRVDLDYLPLLAELAERSPGEVRAVFDSLVARGALVATGSGWYEFGHPLIGELLYDDIGPAARRRVHAAIAARIEGTDHELGMPALERARHVTEGAARGDTVAVTVALRAADRALRTSPRTAARWYGRPLVRPGARPAAPRGRRRRRDPRQAVRGILEGRAAGPGHRSRQESARRPRGGPFPRPHRGDDRALPQRDGRSAERSRPAGRRGGAGERLDALPGTARGDVGAPGAIRIRRASWPRRRGHRCATRLRRTRWSPTRTSVRSKPPSERSRICSRPSTGSRSWEPASANSRWARAPVRWSRRRSTPQQQA